MFRRVPFTTAAAAVAIAAATLGTAAHAQLSSNQLGVANAIAVPVGGNPTAANNAVQTSLAGLAPGDLGGAYSQFTPTGYALLPDLTFQTVEFEESSIRQYLRDFRAGGTGVQGIAGQATPGDRKFGSFAIAGGQYGSYNATADRGRTENSAESGILGVDFRLGAKSLIGVTGGYDRVEARLDPFSQRSRIGSWFTGGYGTFGVGPLYLDLYGSYGETKYDLHRSIEFGGATADPTALQFGAGTGGRTWMGGGTTGLSFNAVGFEFEPFVGARYADLRINGFSDGTDAGAITLGRRSFRSILGTAGVRVGQTIALPNGVSLRPQVSGAYKHEFDRYDFNSFDFGTGAAPATSVNFVPTGLARDYAIVGAGVTVSGANSPFSVVLNYNGQYARDRRINGLTGGFRLTF